MSNETARFVDHPSLVPSSLLDFQDSLLNWRVAYETFFTSSASLPTARYKDDVSDWVWRKVTICLHMSSRVALTRLEDLIAFVVANKSRPHLIRSILESQHARG